MRTIELRPTADSLVSMALLSLAARYSASHFGGGAAYHRWLERIRQRGPLVPTVHSGPYTYVFFDSYAMRWVAGSWPELVP